MNTYHPLLSQALVIKQVQAEAAFEAQHSFEMQSPRVEQSEIYEFLRSAGVNTAS